MQAVIFAAVAELLKALPDGVFLHAGNPQPLDRFGASGQMVDRAEDAFALAPRVAGVDHFGNVLPAQQRPQHVELFPLVRRDGESKVFGDDRQVFQRPFGVVWVIGSSIGQFRQMAAAPGNNVAVALNETVAAPVHAEGGGNALRHAGLFRDNHGFQTIFTPF